MLREISADLMAFVAVAREGSFTRAAVKLGVTQSTLSHTIRGLEERLGVRLLARTTRSVAVTEAGERLLGEIAPRFDEIEAALQSLTSLRDRPSGTLRITAGEHAALTVLWPRIAPLLQAHPDIRVELIIDYGFKDIVAERYDAGVRLGEDVEKDMIVAPIGPDMRMAVVGSPEYFDRHPKPRQPSQLTEHGCINMRLPTHNNLYQWEFEKAGRALKVRVGGPAVFNTLSLRLDAALQGVGLAYLPDDYVRAHVAAGRLVHVLADWCAPFPGYHLYYPSRRQSTPAFALLLEALRVRR